MIFCFPFPFSLPSDKFHSLSLWVIHLDSLGLEVQLDFLSFFHFFFICRDHRTVSHWQPMTTLRHRIMLDQSSVTTLHYAMLVSYDDLCSSHCVPYPTYADSCRFCWSESICLFPSQCFLSCMGCTSNAYVWLIYEFKSCLCLVFSDWKSFFAFCKFFSFDHCHKDIILDLDLGACLTKGLWVVLSFRFILFVRLFIDLEILFACLCQKFFLSFSFLSILRIWFGNYVENVLIFLDYIFVSSLHIWFCFAKEELNSFILFSNLS